MVGPVKESLSIFENNFYKVIFILSLVVGYFLTPAYIFNSNWILLAFIFIITFSFTITYITKNIKEKLSHNHPHSILGFISLILGVSALQVCNLGGCGYGLGASLVLLFPSFFIGFLEKYSVAIIIFSILLQLIALYLMTQKKK